VLAISVSVSVSLYVSALIGYGQLGLLSAAPSTALFTPDRSIVQWPFIVIGSLIAIASHFANDSFPFCLPQFDIRGMAMCTLVFGKFFKQNLEYRSSFWNISNTLDVFLF